MAYRSNFVWLPRALCSFVVVNCLACAAVHTHTHTSVITVREIQFARSLCDIFHAPETMFEVTFIAFLCNIIYELCVVFYRM